MVCLRYLNNAYDFMFFRGMGGGVAFVLMHLWVIHVL